MFKKVITTAITTAILGCGPKPKQETYDISLIEQLKQKHELYLQLLPQVQDKHGYVDTDHCDALLFTGLLGTVTEVAIEASRDDSGAWYRRPIERPCYPDSSASTISRDMLIGLIWYSYKNNRLDLLEQLFEYGLEHNWIMGKGDIARTYFTPSMQSLLARVIYKMGGTNHMLYRSIPIIISKVNDYQAHLAMLQILLLAEVTGYTRYFEVIQYNYNRNPKNALFSYMYHRFYDGDQTETITNLLNTTYYPADKLPTDCDRGESWLHQRDYGSDWEPDNKCTGKKHSGGDFLFISNMLL